MRRRVTMGLVLVAGVFTAHPLPPNLAVWRARSEPRSDPRLARLQQFLRAMNSPAENLAAEFLEAADVNDLDWRLLPSISVVESGGGKEAPHYNIFGWNCGRERFRSVSDAIRAVAGKLATLAAYKDKETEDLLETYNPGHAYCLRVKAVMQAIGPEDPAEIEARAAAAGGVTQPHSR